MHIINKVVYLPLSRVSHYIVPVEPTQCPAIPQAEQNISYLHLVPCLTSDGSCRQVCGWPGVQGGEGAGCPVWHLAAAQYYEEEVWRAEGESCQL